jgi:hypothetical protein
MTGWLELQLNIKTKQTAATHCSTCFNEKNVNADRWKVVDLGV